MDLQEILLFKRPVYAHRDKDGVKENETLETHTALCEKYFQKLMCKKKMVSSMNELKKVLIGDMPAETGEWFEAAFSGVISFHDTGKINPYFQTGRMLNPAFEKIQMDSVKGSNHSVLSAAIYLDYFLEKAEKINLEKNDKVKMYEILLMNAFVIARHHGNLAEYREFVNKLHENEEVDIIWKSMELGKYSELYRGRFSHINSEQLFQRIDKSSAKWTEEQKFAKYIYMRLLFSLLTASDYYATTEYMSGLETCYFGSADEIREIGKEYEKTARIQNIRAFSAAAGKDDGKDINFLRNCMFLEAEEQLLKNRNDTIFFLEAPTGIGKSNVAMNCSFKLLDHEMDKIIYVYPFNNLVEQNMTSLKDIFGETGIFSKIAVVNSITPIPVKKENENNEEETSDDYMKALLNRQFLNYPLILTSHVSLFQTMFGTEREAVFGFHQLVGSVLVLDEIQSYKNTLWSEIIRFLQMYGKFLHCKVLIMSATLPDLSYLVDEKTHMVNLLKSRDKYFVDARFKDRVTISYELLSQQVTMAVLYEHIKKQALLKKKIMVEFIKKEMAYDFYKYIVNAGEIQCAVERMTGDDNSIDRQMILKKAKDKEYCRNGFILVATQVVEAGIDIDMDIGYKDISLLDSEEQFLGRINRNCKRHGMVCFFNMCDAKKIYRNDFRNNKSFTLEEPAMQKVLQNKNFSGFYGPVLELLKQSWNRSEEQRGIKYFVNEEIGKLDFAKVEQRMKLIEDNQWDMSVFLARNITDSAGKCIDGREVWEKYKELLKTPIEDYAKFRIEMSRVKSELNYFIYRIKKNSNIAYHDKVGELYYIENGEDYFEDDKLNKNALENKGALFLEL